MTAKYFVSSTRVQRHTRNARSRIQTLAFVFFTGILTMSAAQTSYAQTNTFPASGNVGIGTTSPGQLLHINSATANNALAAFSVNGTTDSFWGVSGGTDNIITGSLLGDSLLRSQGKNILLSTDSGASAQLYLKNGGNVGIGTTSPGYTLDVNGTINSSSTITGSNIVAKYQDLAEWVPASEKLYAGTVVILDPTKSNQVTSSTVSYDTRVAGVVSEQPGIALGERSDSKALVATTGRVKVKVDASKGAIHIGDLLVTSDISGMAMKSEPVNLGGVQIHRPGTLIGKALEPLEKGKGEILVLLSLQ